MIGRRTLLATAMLAAPAGVTSRARAGSAARVVTLGGAVTESVCAVGAGGLLVGSDLTSTYPAMAAVLPRVGYVRAIGAEGVLSLRPDLVLASADAGPPAALQQVAAAQVELVVLPEAHTPDAATGRVLRVGEALGRTAQAQEVVAAMRSDLSRVLAAVPGGAAPRVLFLLSAGRGAPMASGTGTAADAMIRLAGGVNVAGSFANYRPLSPEALLLAAPALVLTTSQTLDGVGGIAGLHAAVPGLDPAVPVAGFEGLYLLGFGPRLAHALRDLTLALHGGAAIPALPPRSWAA